MNPCPAGHASKASDYCDVCGVAIDAAPSPSDTALMPAVGTATDTPCPHCGAANPVDALFCEACGYDFTTGTLPRPLTPPDPTTPPVAESPAPPLAPAWVVEVWIDPDWYSDQGAGTPMPSPGLPTVVPIRHTSVMIGRASNSRNITPDIDLGSDSGVSRRHAQLSTDGTRWFVEDLRSSNGTYVADAVSGLPKTPIAVGVKRELASDDRIYLGAWTRLVVREAVAGDPT